MESVLKSASLEEEEVEEVVLLQGKKKKRAVTDRNLPEQQYHDVINN